MEGLADHLEWLRVRGLRPATIQARRNAVRRLARRLDHEPLTATAAELAGWQRQLSLSAVGLATETMHVTCFFRWAHEEGLIGSNPAVRLPRPKLPRRLPRPIADEKLALALAHAPPDIRLVLTFAAFCGMRAGELARLQRGDVLDTNVRPVVIIDGKGGRERAVPLSTRVLSEIRAYSMPARGAVFPRWDGRPGGMTPDRLSQLVNHYLHGLGIPDTLHSARHWYGTNLHAITGDLRLTQEMMGHADPGTTAGYVQYSPARAAEAMEALGGGALRVVPHAVRPHAAGVTGGSSTP